MIQIKEMSIGELAAFVCSHLLSSGIKCVLTGGACVSIYTANKYQSFDLDFIEEGDVKREELKKLLAEINFEEKNRYFINKDTEFFIEFPPGPLTAGSEQITKYNELSYKTGTLLLLTPTDSVKDRLAAYFHWDDKQALEQAIWISENHKIDNNEINRWSKVEGQLKKFNAIKQYFHKK